MHLVHVKLLSGLWSGISQCDFRFGLFFSFSFVLVLQYFFVSVLVLVFI